MTLPALNATAEIDSICRQLVAGIEAAKPSPEDMLDLQPPRRLALELLMALGLVANVCMGGRSRLAVTSACKALLASGAWASVFVVA